MLGTLDTFKLYTERRLLFVFVMGFASGLPLLLTMGTLQIWLTEVGVSLTAVGLLPAALVGIDIEGLIRGADRALEKGTETDLLKNPAALYAGLLWAADAWLGAKIHVLMPYSDRLRDFGAWFVQLWAESLGKRVDRRGQPVFAGPTPLGAVGASDQHSQVQLFMEGPFDKVVTFIRIEAPGEDIRIPHRPDLPEEMAYLQGHSLGELLHANAQLGRLGAHRLERNERRAAA